LLPVCQPRSSHPGLHIVGKPFPNLIVQHAWPSVRKAPKRPPVIGAPRGGRGEPPLSHTGCPNSVSHFSRRTREALKIAANCGGSLGHYSGWNGAQFAIAGLGSHSQNRSSGVTRQMSNETIFRGSRSPPETKLHSDGLGSDNGVDHVGHHHQPILPPVLQGFAERHSISDAPLGLMGTFGIPAVSRA
jgi:hypothetical protein